MTLTLNTIVGLTFVLILVLVTYVSSSVSPIHGLNSVQPNTAEFCHWEGQKISNPDFDDKFFLCHFYPVTKKWLLYPISCIPHHRFLTEAQRCLKFDIIPHGRGQHVVAFEHFVHDNIITEIPDAIPPFKSQPVEAAEKVKAKSEKYRSESRSKQNLKSGQDECGESLRSLSATISVLSKTIDKLSAKVNQPQKPAPQNATINVKMPNFPSFAEFLHFSPKFEEIDFLMPKPTETQLRPVVKNKSEPLLTLGSSPNTESLPAVTTTTFSTTPLPKHMVVSTTSPTSGVESEEAIGSQSSVSVRPPGFMDFLFKNILSPAPFRPSQPIHQIPKTPFQLNISRPQNHGGVLKPLPFRPRPPGPPSHHIFSPIRSSSPQPPSNVFPEPNLPRPPTYVNMLSFLKKINEANPFRIDESDEDDTISEEWNDIADIFSPRTPKPVVRISNPTTLTTAPLPLPTTTMSTFSNETGSSSSSSNLLTNDGSEMITRRSSNSKEFDNNDDEAEEDDDDEALRLNNRKPRSGFRV